MQEGISLDEAIRYAKEKGIDDPLVECHIHNVSIKLSELSSMSRCALEEGIDTTPEFPCILTENRVIS